MTLKGYAGVLARSTFFFTIRACMQSWHEEALIEHLKGLFSVKPPLFGIGDDCAVIPDEGGKVWLVTSDALVEGVHFLKEKMTALDLGYKAVAVNVSDICAMGGEPKYAFLSIAIPKHITQNWMHAFLQGIKQACELWGIVLLGGDSVGSKSCLFINLTLIGTGTQEQLKYRHVAKSGDVICLTGYLGDSGAGLKALQQETAQHKDRAYLLQAHFRPKPMPHEGLWLSKKASVHAMMDVSDGLDPDLKRLIASSHKGAIVEVGRLPLSKALIRTCQKEGWDALELALVGGEDYCLLLTVASEAFDEIAKAFYQKFNKMLFNIGSISDPPAKVIYRLNGKNLDINYKPFTHF